MSQEQFKPEMPKHKAEEKSLRAEIRIEPGLVGQQKWTADKRLTVTKFVIDADGRVMLRIERYDMAAVPQDVDDAEFEAAESYDKAPQVEMTEIDPHRAGDLLADVQRQLETAIMETKEEMDSEEDTGRYHLLEDSLFDLKSELDEVVKARQTLSVN